MINQLSIDDIITRIGEVYEWTPGVFTINAICPFGHGVAVVFQATLVLHPNKTTRTPSPGIAIVHHDGTEIVKDTEPMRLRRMEIHDQRKRSERKTDIHSALKATGV